MLQPLWANSAQLDTFNYGDETYIILTFFFHSPPQPQQTWRPPIEFMPVATIIMPRQSWKGISTKFLGYMARQDEPPPQEPKEEQPI